MTRPGENQNLAPIRANDKATLRHLSLRRDQRNGNVIAPVSGDALRQMKLVLVRFTMRTAPRPLRKERLRVSRSTPRSRAGTR